MVLTMKEKEITHPIKRATADLELILQMTLVDVANKNSMTLFKNMHRLDDFLEFPISGIINPALMMQKASSVQWPLPMIMLNVALL